MELITQSFIDTFTTNFNLTVIIFVNILTYSIIQLWTGIPGKNRSTWDKRIVFVIASIITLVLHLWLTNIEPIVIINSLLIAPVSWSWLLKPICKKLGIDYNKYKTD